MSEDIIRNQEFTVKIDCGDVYINGKFYRQLCWTPDAVACVIDDYLNGVPADGEENEE